MGGRRGRNGRRQCWWTSGPEWPPTGWVDVGAGVAADGKVDVGAGAAPAKLSQLRVRRVIPLR